MSDYADVLRGGDWVTRAGVRVWIPAAASAKPKTPPDQADLIACPTCRARLFEPCRTSGGQTRINHRRRLVRRRCTCGAVVPPRQVQCPDCSRATAESRSIA